MATDPNGPLNAATEDELRKWLITCDHHGKEVKRRALDELIARAWQEAIEDYISDRDPPKDW